MAIDEVFVSPVTAREITTKYRIGKLPHAAVVAIDVPAAVASEAFRELPLTMAHGQRAGSMAGEHRDPFNRMLVAQAPIEGLVLVSNEQISDRFGVTRLW